MKRKSIGILTGAENLCSDYKSWNKRGLHLRHTLEAIRIIADRSTSGSRAPSLEALWRIIISDGGWGILRRQSLWQDIPDVVAAKKGFVVTDKNGQIRSYFGFQKMGV